VKIYNSSNENIGDVNDLIVDKKGNIDAVVVGVGGFLGIGEKNVALPYGAITWSDTPPEATQPSPAMTPATTPQGATPGTQAVTPPVTPQVPAIPAVLDYPSKGVLDMSKDQLKNAPEFKFASQAANQ
jgi:hypothetical protein